MMEDMPEGGCSTEAIESIEVELKIVVDMWSMVALDLFFFLPSRVVLVACVCCWVWILRCLYEMGDSDRARVLTGLSVVVSRKEEHSLEPH